LPHFLAHATLLHGVISDTVLPFSQYAFNMPAWSLSLEWQFYLVAPAIVSVARWPHAMVCVAIMIAVAEIAFHHRFFGSFEQPSFLLAVAGYFAVGVASRLVYSYIAGTIRHPAAILSLVIVLLPLLDSWGVPLLIWGLIITGLALHPSAQTSLFARIYRLALESPAAVYFGSRSYSTYLCHLQIISVSYWLWLSLFSTAPTFLGLSILTVPLTIVAAELLYRCVERPGIALGSRMARGRMQTIANFGRKSAVIG
jgi:peptidoglycan/LPS O-acetylase OafA/YrhL